MIWGRGFVLLQLFGLLIISLVYCNAQGNETSSPPPPPAKAPPPPKFTLGSAVEGVVYCMSCRLPHYEPSMNASPLPGLNPKVVCNSSKSGLSINGNATTDSKGYFLIQVQGKKHNELTTCRVALRLPVWCNKPVYPKASKAGYHFTFDRVAIIESAQTVVFTTGLLAFSPTNSSSCPRQP